MTLAFIFWGAYEGFKDALACAKARAGCPIYVISDQTDPGGVIHLPIASFQNGYRAQKTLGPRMGHWESLSLARWFVLRDLAKQRPYIFPVFCADWDVLIFRNLAEAYAPFMGFDYTVSRLPTGMESAAYGVNRLEPLDAFCRLVECLDAEGAKVNDMEAWARNGRAHNWNVGNLYEIQNNSVFDHSMHCGAERFQMDGPALKVIYNEGMPRFVTHDGSIVIANSAHCWGSYKTRTREMRKKAGIEI